MSAEVAQATTPVEESKKPKKQAVVPAEVAKRCVETAPGLVIPPHTMKYVLDAMLPADMQLSREARELLHQYIETAAGDEIAQTVKLCAHFEQARVKGADLEMVAESD